MSREQIAASVAASLALNAPAGCRSAFDVSLKGEHAVEPGQHQRRGAGQAEFSEKLPP
jgi:hypothetical protein